MNLNQIQLQNLNPVATCFWSAIGARVCYNIYDDYIREPKDEPATVKLRDYQGYPIELNETYRLQNLNGIKLFDNGSVKVEIDPTAGFGLII